VNFSLSFSYKSELDLLLEDTAVGYNRDAVAKIEGKKEEGESNKEGNGEGGMKGEGEGKEESKGEAKGEDKEGDEPTLVANIDLDPGEYPSSSPFPSELIFVFIFLL